MGYTYNVRMNGQGRREGRPQKGNQERDDQEQVAGSGKPSRGALSRKFPPPQATASGLPKVVKPRQKTPKKAV